MTPLIQIINKHGGDVMKFSGDAVSVMWPFEEEEEAREMVLMATACCIELHAELHNFDTQVPLGDPAEKRVSARRGRRRCPPFASAQPTACRTRPLVVVVGIGFLFEVVLASCCQQ